MLPVLLKLLHMSRVLDQVPQVLTDLLQTSPAMQKAANDSDAVSSLATILHHEHSWHNRPRFKASTPGKAVLTHAFSSGVYVSNVRHWSICDVLLNGPLLSVYKGPVL